jgi:hypothetical protein
MLRTPSSVGRMPSGDDLLDEKLSIELGVADAPLALTLDGDTSLNARSLPFASRSRLKLNDPSVNVPSV